jgi:uncharacterized protein GlcG (DUF336 family)
VNKTLVIYSIVILAALMAFARPSLADERASACDIPQAVVDNLQSKLAIVVNASDHNGGLFKPNRMWSAIVDRKGRLCSVIKVNDAWPGSRDIAIAKASTANDFSNSAIALSTAMLYGPTQPGGSLYGLNNSNPFNPVFNQEGSGIGYVPGGIITFGGGVPLYSGGQVVGGLGVSGDTSCADASIAYRMRKIAGGLTSGIPNDDNIQYYPSPRVDPAQFKQPHCIPSDLTAAEIAAYTPSTP